MKAKSSGFGPSLIELVVAVLLLCVASAVCVRIFAGAKVISDNGAALSGASIQAQNAAECFKASAGDCKKTAALVGGTATESGFEVRYNRDWIADSEGKYLLSGTVADEQGLVVCKISVTDNNGEIFGITAASHGEAEK